MKPAPQLCAAEKANAGKRHVHHAEHGLFGEIARKQLDDIKPPGGVAAADHRADRGAGDDVGMNAMIAKLKQDADMRPAARSAGAERNANLRAPPPLRRARPIGAALAVRPMSMTQQNLVQAVVLARPGRPDRRFLRHIVETSPRCCRFRNRDHVALIANICSKIGAR